MSLKRENSNVMEDPHHNSMQRNTCAQPPGLVSDYSVNNEDGHTQSVYHEMIKKPKYMLPQVR